MKKLCKLLIFIIKVTAIAALVNYHIKILAAYLRGESGENDLSYDYNFGNVAYTKKGSGPAMLLLHSPKMNASRAEWEPLIKRLSKNYTVYAPDLPGFGHSAQPEVSYSAYLYSSFINAFIEDVIEEKAIVMASGRAADFSVCAATLAPNNFEKLVLISPKGFSDDAPRCKIRCTIKKIINTPLYGTFLYNLVWLDFLVKDVLLSLPKLNLPKAKQSSRFAMSALVAGDMDLCIKDALTKAAPPAFIALGNTDPISGTPSDIETHLFCNADGCPHLGNDRDKFIAEVENWLAK